MIKLLIFLPLISLAQTATWKAPEGAGKEYQVLGYRINYEIQKDADCAADDMKHFVDVGDKLSYVLNEDRNFIPGATYRIQIVSYNEYGISAPSKEFGCAQIKGLPKVDDEIETQGDQNETFSFSAGSILLPRANASTSRDGNGNLESRQQSNRRDDANAKSLPLVLGPKGATDKQPNRNRPSVSDTNLNRSRTQYISPVDVKTGMASKAGHLLRNDSSDIRWNDDNRVSPISPSLQINADHPPKESSDSDNRVTYWVVGILALLLSIFLLRGIK